MRSRLTPDLLLIGVLLVVTLGIATFAARSGRGPQGEEQEIPARRTTYSTAPGGYQAVFETLEALDYPVRRWRFTLDGLPERGTLIVADPERPVTSKEWRGLVNWVRQGNLLIYLSDSSIDWLEQRPGAAGETREGGQQATEDDDGSDTPLPPDFSPLAPAVDVPARPSRPTQPTPLAAVAPELRTRSLFHLGPPEPSPSAAAGGGQTKRGGRLKKRITRAPRRTSAPSTLLPLYRDAGGATVAYTRWGRGSVILCSSPWSLCNAGVGQADNFAWLLAVLAAYAPDSGVQAFRRSGVRADGSKSLNAQDHRSAAVPPERLTPIFFDEGHHGYGEARGVLSLLAPIARLGLAQLAIAWLLLTYAVSRRFGGKVPDEGRVRRSRSEYLGSMAALLHHARAVDLAVGQVLRQFRHDACRALGLPRDVKEAELLAGASTRGVDTERLRSLLEQAERLARERDRTKQDEAVTVARELVRIRGQLSGRRSPERGSPPSSGI